MVNTYRIRTYPKLSDSAKSLISSTTVTLQSWAQTPAPSPYLLQAHAAIARVLWSLEFGAGVLHEFLLINLVEMTYCRTHAGCIARATAGHTARTNFGLSTGRLAGGKHAEKKLRPLNRSVERRIPVGCGHRRCRIGRMELCFDREFESGVFAMGKWLRIACFLTSVFLIINVFPHFLEKRIEQLLHQSLEPTFSVLHITAMDETIEKILKEREYIECLANDGSNNA